MYLVCNDEAALKRNEGFLHGRSLENWMGRGVYLEQPKQHNGKDGGGMVMEKGSQR